VEEEAEGEDLNVWVIHVDFGGFPAEVVAVLDRRPSLKALGEWGTNARLVLKKRDITIVTSDEGDISAERHRVRGR